MLGMALRLHINLGKVQQGTRWPQGAMVVPPLPLGLCAQVRVMASGKMRTYIAQAIALLQEKNLPTIQLKAMGRRV